MHNMEKTYYSPQVQKPNCEILKKLSSNIGLEIDPGQIEDYKDVIDGFIDNYSVLNDFPEPTLPVKYPRTPGHRPAPIDNPYNAWYWQTDISGATEGLLKGKTVGIKDNVAVAGVPMMNGTKILEGYTPEFDATVVTRILDEGGRILGKTACEDMCFSANSFTCSTGPVRNPNDETRASGGSSSGSAALVAGGHIDLAIGGDQAGSVRVPSSWCGIVGLKPTYGLVPYTGAMPMEFTVDHLGPMAKTVFDCALMLEAIAGYDDGLDPRQHPGMEIPKYTQMLSNDLTGLKVGILKEGFAACDVQVEKCVKEAIQKFATAGALVEEVSMPLHLKAGQALIPALFEGSYLTMIHDLGSAINYNGFYPNSMINAWAKGLQSRAQDCSVVVKAVSLMCAYMRKNYHQKFYGKAQNVKRYIRQQYNEVLQKYDVLVMPTVKFPAPLLPEKSDSLKDLIEGAMNMIANTAVFNQTGHPAVSVNAGYFIHVCPCPSRQWVWIMVFYIIINQLH